MCGSKKNNWRPWGRKLAVSHLALAMFLLGGCAYWSDSPKAGTEAEADSGSDEAFPTLGNDRRPRRMSSDDKATLTEGLVADRANANYAQSALNREGAPTRPLNPAQASAPPPTVRTAAPQAAAAPQPVAAPATASAAPSSSVATPTERRPYVPSPSAVDPVPPPPRVVTTDTSGDLPRQPSMDEGAADIGSPPPPPPGPESFNDVYARRLAEFDRTQPRPNVEPQRQAYVPSAAAVPMQNTPVSMSPPGGQTIHLIKPGTQRASESGSPARALSAYAPGNSDSFLVGAVAFGEGTAALSAAEIAKLKEIAVLAKKPTTRAVRVIGHSSSMRLDVNLMTNQDANRQLAAERADQVVRELIRLGVPARKIYAGAGDAAFGGDDATEILIDY